MVDMKIILASLGFEPISYTDADKKHPHGYKHVENSESFYALGLPYIHAYLESKGHNVVHINHPILDFDKSKDIIENKILTFSPDYIGFSMVTQNRVNTYRMIEYIHEIYPKIKIIIGGIHVTIMYEQLIEKYPYVIAVIGEGEITFDEIMNTNNLYNVKGIAFYDKGVIKTENRELIDNLDILPFPKHPVQDNRTLAIVLSSRGCTYSCSFCVLNPHSKRIQRMRSVKNVVDEIEYLIKFYPKLKSIFFADDAFMLNNDRVIEICKEIIKRKINHIAYFCSSRFKPFKEEMLPYLKEAGFRSLMFGLESANENLLKKCHKNIKIQDAIDTITLLKDSKIILHIFLIVGLPGETKETVLETAHFIQKIQKIKYIAFYNHGPTIISVYPGTEIYELMKNSGNITDGYWLSDGTTPAYTLDYSVDELIELKHVLIDRIVFNPLSWKKIYYQTPMLFYIVKFCIEQKSFDYIIHSIVRFVCPDFLYNRLIKKYKEAKGI